MRNRQITARNRELLLLTNKEQPRDLWLLRYLMKYLTRVMRKHDLSNLMNFFFTILTIFYIFYNIWHLFKVKTFLFHLTSNIHFLNSTLICDLFFVNLINKTVCQILKLSRSARMILLWIHQYSILRGDRASLLQSLLQFL